MDQLCAYITSYDLVSLRDAWAHLDQRVFSRLEHQFTPAIRKLESSLLKMYVINAVQTNRNDKLMEFFEKMSSELQNQPEWKEWFGAYDLFSFFSDEIYVVLASVVILIHFPSVAICEGTRRKPSLWNVFHKTLARHAVGVFAQFFERHLPKYAYPFVMQFYYFIVCEMNNLQL